VKEGSVVADLKKDYFLLCKKENLARTRSAKRPASLEAPTSCTVSHVCSPTSPCQWSVAFSRPQRLDSVFEADVKPATDFTSSADDVNKEVDSDFILSRISFTLLRE